MLGLHDNKNYNSKREDLEEEDQGEDERIYFGKPQKTKISVDRI